MERRDHLRAKDAHHVQEACLNSCNPLSNSGFAWVADPQWFRPNAGAWELILKWSHILLETYHPVFNVYKKLPWTVTYLPIFSDEIRSNRGIVRFENFLGETLLGSHPITTKGVLGPKNELGQHHTREKQAVIMKSWLDPVPSWFHHNQENTSHIWGPDLSATISANFFFWTRFFGWAEAQISFCKSNLIRPLQSLWEVVVLLKMSEWLSPYQFL